MPRVASTVDTYAYAEPDPVTVAKLLASHGVDAACERWSWKSRDAVLHIAEQGQEILRARSGHLVRPSRRTTTPEAEERILQISRALGNASEAARNLGVSETLVRTLHRERGLPIPTKPAAARVALAVASRKRNAAGEAKKGYQPRDIDSAIVMKAWRDGQPVKAIAKSVGCSGATVYRLLSDRGAINGVPKKLPDDSTIRADLAAGMTQHAMAARYGCTQGAVCHRIAAMDLQGCSAIPRSVRKIPDDETLRRDRASGLTLRVAAVRYGIARSVVGRHWKRLGIDGRWSNLTLEMEAA